jgi:hypothetical protein
LNECVADGKYIRRFRRRLFGGAAIIAATKIRAEKPSLKAFPDLPEHLKHMVQDRAGPEIERMVRDKLKRLLEP